MFTFISNRQKWCFVGLIYGFKWYLPAKLNTLSHPVVMWADSTVSRANSQDSINMRPVFRQNICVIITIYYALIVISKIPDSFVISWHKLHKISVNIFRLDWVSGKTCEFEKQICPLGSKVVHWPQFELHPFQKFSI